MSQASESRALIPRSRVFFPLWARFGTFFGGLVCSLMALYGWYGFRVDQQAQAARRQEEATGLAATLAAGIDGDAHGRMTDASAMHSQAYRELHAWLLEAKLQSGLKWVGTTARDSRGRDHFVVDAGKGAVLPIGYPIFDGVLLRDRVYAGATIYVPDFVDEWGSWQTAMAPILDSEGRTTGVLEIVHDTAVQQLHTQRDKKQLALRVLLAGLGILLGAFFSARYVNRHLRELTAAAQDVARGNLDRRVRIRSSDEIGMLGQAFDEMLRGLREREHIRDTFGRFVDPEVVEQVLANPTSPALGGDRRVVTVLMSDLRGFTALSARLDPERMVALLNRYFARMAAVITSHQGTIAELMGDGLVAFFGAPTLREDDARRAVACAVAMQLELGRFNEEEGRELQMGIGIDTGEVIAGNIGSEQHMKYGVVGEAINLAARLESFTVGNQVLISAATAAAAGDALDLAPAIEVMAKGRSEPLVCHPVRAAEGTSWHRLPKQVSLIGVAVQLKAQWHAIDGKQVSPKARDATVVRLALPRLLLDSEPSPKAYSKLKLSLELEDGRRLDEIYATVTSADRPAELHVTSLPDEARAQLETRLHAPSSDPGALPG